MQSLMKIGGCFFLFNARMRECENARMRKCKNARIQEYKNTRIQECKNARMQECKNDFGKTDFLICSKGSVVAKFYRQRNLSSETTPDCIGKPTATNAQLTSLLCRSPEL